MSETDPQPGLSLDDYQRLVEETWRHEDHGLDNWRDEYATLLRSEFGELLSQHGLGNILLISLEQADTQQAKETIVSEDRGTYDGVVEELGDLLWFGFKIATESGIDPKQASSQALSSHAKTGPISVQTFGELQALVSEHAAAIKVPSKWALRHPDLSSSGDYYSLAKQPSYVLMRMIYRMARALEGGKGDVPPYTASMLEPVPDLDQSIGDFINTITYTAHDLLGVDIEEVARRNISKLRSRAVNK